MRVLIINGPNLNLLGSREPEIYGSDTLDDLERKWRLHATRIGVGIATFQSNHEGAIIDAIQGAVGRFDGIVINPGALSHYSYAIYDALVSVGIPTVEIHISNIYEREQWRGTSVTGDAAIGIIYGRGPLGYVHALDLVVAHIAIPPTTFRYGEGDDRVLDIRTPPNTGAPIAILVHGGFWRDIWKRDLMAPMAVALTRMGWATANIEYTRGAASFPQACDDVTAAIAEVTGIAPSLDLAADRIVIVGHSAGGYLALRAAHTVEDLAGTVALAPVTDLEEMSVARPDDDPVSAFLDASLDSDPERWRAASLPGEPRSPVALIHGSLDADVPVSQTTAYGSRHANRVNAQLVEGTGHMELIDPCDPAFEVLTGVLADLSGR